MDLVYKEATVEDAGDRTFKFIASDETPDSYGDVILASGWDLKRYKRNPIVLFGHKTEMPVGFSPSTKVEGTKLIATIKLADEGTSDFIDTLFKLMKQKIVRAVSVGFRPTMDPSIRRDKDGHMLGYEFNGQELLENSVVSVPANPNALSLAKSWGARDSTINRIFAEDAIVQAAKRQRTLDLLRLGASSIIRK